MYCYQVDIHNPRSFSSFFVAITNLERDSLYFHLLQVILLLPQEEVLSLLGGFHRHKEKNWQSARCISVYLYILKLIDFYENPI